MPPLETIIHPLAAVSYGGRGPGRVMPTMGLPQLKLKAEILSDLSSVPKSLASNLRLENLLLSDCIS